MEAIETLAARLELDERERRLVDRARQALVEGRGGDPGLRMRLRNRSELYREQAARQRLGGSLAGVEGLDERRDLFRQLHRALEDQSAGAT